MEQIQTMIASATPVAGMTLLEAFMTESYDFRHNVLSDKYEVREKGTAAWRPLTDQGINSIARRLKRELDDSKSWKSAVEEYVKTLAGCFPDLKVNQSTIIKVGNVLKNMQFEQKKD